MITALLFFALLAFSEGAHPTCPNNQEPKLNFDGTPVQCLPGAFQSLVCGKSHTCFFSGMNYMCCPSNEPNAENLPSCPKASLTVLDGHGQPLKCSPRTRQCPQKNMFCTDVGLAFICCETESQEKSQEKIIEESGEVQQTRTVKRVLKKKKKTTAGNSHECPEGSIGLLNQYGEPRKCTSSTGCPGFNQFCYGGEGGPICCERVEFAQNNLDPTPEITTPPPSSRSRAKSQFQSVPIVSGAIEGTGRVRKPNLPNILASGENLGHKSRLNALPIAVAVSSSKTTPIPRKTLPSLETLPPVPTEPIDDLLEKPLIIFSTTEEPTTKARAFAIKTNTRTNEFATPAATLTRGRASELLNGEEKRAMAQRFLMHQIRNGWPYDDRFYRPDMDTFTNEQRQDIAKLRFIDN